MRKAALLKELPDIDMADALVFGNKAARLGYMSRAGFPVPPGLALSDASFRLFLKHANLDSLLQQLTRTLSSDGNSEAAVLLASIRAAILGTDLPSDLLQLLTAALEARAWGPYFAVRTSAKEEDSSTTSWAGQFTTLLNVKAENLAGAVRRCWASAFADSILTYSQALNTVRNWNEFGGVIVQEFIDADHAGVAFSVNPVTGNNSEIVIEACAGLGQLLVEGRVNPDRYVVSRLSDHITFQIGTQTQLLTGGAEGGLKIVNEMPKDRHLSTLDVLQLKALVEQLETTFGIPVDVEWAKKGTNIWALQSRPVTTTRHQSTSSTEMPALALDNYKLVFRVKKIDFLLADILMGHYRQLDCIFLQNADSFSQWIGEDTISKAGKEGFETFANIHRLHEYQSEMTRRVDYEAESFARFTSISWPESRDELAIFFRACTDLIEHYSKMDEIYIDNLVPILDKPFLFDTLGAYKNEARNLVNQALIGPTSHLALVLEIVSRQVDVAVTQLQSYSVREILDIACEHNAVEEGVLKLRATAYMMLGKKGKSSVLVGEQALRAGAILSSRNSVNVQEIAGIVANGSDVLVYAPATVVSVDYGNTEAMFRAIEAMHSGDVLVAETTAPELVAACRKASAIVTDIGGILSHAAIVSRELGIPCIVGTEIATKVIQNREVVEVDCRSSLGEAGTVRRTVLGGQY